jgi:hypothetical protein
METEIKEKIKHGKVEKEVKKKEIAALSNNIQICCQRVIDEGYGDMSKWGLEIPPKYLRIINLVTKLEKLIYSCIRSGLECMFDHYGLHVSLHGILECAKEERWRDFRWLNNLWNDYQLDTVENWPRFIEENKDLFRCIVFSQKLYIRRQKVMKISHNYLFIIFEFTYRLK